jgi:hypothetical protein
VGKYLIPREMMTGKTRTNGSGGVRTAGSPLCVALLFAMLLAGAPVALAATASELFADGNRLFHDQLYWAALLRYNQAAEAGMDTPLLDYNTGVAHYKAKQYGRARAAFLEASRYAPLQAISHYNLGLVAYRSDDRSEAIRWLQSARDQQDRRDISRLAVRALREIASQDPRYIPSAAQREALFGKRAFTNLDLRVRVGVGFDDNVYRSPDQTYRDLADPAQPVVTPVVQSGNYVPVSINALYQVNSFEHEGFFAAYRYGGRFYPDKLLNQADEYFQELAFGSEYRRKNEERERRVYGAFKAAQHKEVYYDPDTGVERIVGGDDISDRMSYLRYGPEFWIRETFGPLSVGARVKGQLWNYEAVTTVPEYDHEHWLFGVNTQWRYSESSLVRVTAEYYTRRFGDRPSYDLNGSQPAGNPAVRYDYVDVALIARQRITTAMWFGLSYRMTEREDRYVGYNNYSRDEFSLDYHQNIGQRFDFEVFGRYRIYNFENAFAFNNPAAGRKDLETFDIGAKASFRLTDSFELAGEYVYRDVASNDTRIAYNRSLLSLALRWNY